MVGCILRDMLFPLLRWLSLMLVVLRIEETVASVSFSIRVPGETILALPGDTLTLPCSVSPAFHPSEVRWYRPDKFETPILLYKDGQLEKATDPQYRGRASLAGGLNEGNASLKLENLTVSDSGAYVCYIQHASWYERGHVHTEVRVLGSAPLIAVTDRGSGQVNVTCVSEGWFPQPTFIWRNRKGIEIKKGLNEAHYTDDQGLMTVSSWMLVSPSDLDALFCSVGLPDLKRMESRVALHLSREQSCTPTGAWKDVVIAILAICLVVVGIYHLYKKGLIKWPLSQKNSGIKKEATDEENARLNEGEQTQHGAHSKEMPLTKSEEISKDVAEKMEIPPEKPPEKPKGENKETNTEVDVSQTPEWDEAKRHKVTLTVENGPLSLKVTVKGKGVTMVQCPQPEKIHGHDQSFPHVLCTGPLSSGSYYWEVDMKKADKQSWYVGVCSTTAAKLTTRVPIIPENGFWVLQYEKGTGLFANTKPPLLVPTVKRLCKLGVYLKSSKPGIHTLSFYNVETGWPLCSFKYFKQSGGLTPVLSPGLRDKDPLFLC